MNSLRVLHIENEPDIREVVAFSLGLDPGFVVRSCASGEAGLADAQTADIPVVFMTARAQTRECEHFKSLGAGVISKPFDPMTLAASVRSHARPTDAQRRPQLPRKARVIAATKAHEVVGCKK